MSFGASTKRHTSIWRPDNHVARPPTQGLPDESQTVAEKRILVSLICLCSGNAISR